MRQTIYVILVVLGMDLSLHAQFAGTTRYDHEDGLNKINATRIFQTSTGEIWIGSNGSGAYKYENGHWKNIPVSKESLLNGWVNNFFEDAQGGLWFLHGYEVGATRLYKNQFTQYVLRSKSLIEKEPHQQWLPTNEFRFFQFQNKSKNPYCVAIDGAGNLIKYDFNYESHCFDTEAEIIFTKSEIDNSAFDTSKYYVYYDESLKEYYLREHKTNKYALYYKTLGKIDLDVCNKDCQMVRPAQRRLILSCNEGTQLSMQDEACNILRSHVVPKIDGFQLPATAKLKVKKVQQDYAQLPSTKFISIWTIETETSHPSMLILCNHDSTLMTEKCIMVDESNPPSNTSYLNESFFYSKNQTLNKLHSEFLTVPIGDHFLNENTWSANQLNDGNIVFTSYDNGLLFFDGFRLSKMDSKFDHFIRFLDGNYKDHNGHIYFISARLKSEQELFYDGILKLEDKHTFKILAPNTIGFYLAENDAGELMYGTRDEGLWILPKNKEGVNAEDWRKIDASKGLRLKNVLTALQDQNSNYWMGRGSQGLSFYSQVKDTVMNWIKEDDMLNMGVQSMDTDPYGNLWLGTEKGLFVINDYAKLDINRHTDIWKHAQSVATDYTGNSMIEICKIYKNELLVIANATGLFLLDLKEWDKDQSLWIHSYTEDNGYNAGSAVQNGIFFDKDNYIWTLGSNAAVRFDPSSVDKEIFNIYLDIDSLRSNGQSKLYEHKPITLGVLDRSFSIFCQAQSRSVQGEMVDPLMSKHYIRYKLDDQENWSPLESSGVLQFTNMDPGSHAIQIVAERNGRQSEIKTVKIRIKQLFWKRLDFWMLLFALSVLAGLYLRKRQQKWFARELEIKTAELELQKLRKDRNRLQVKTISSQLNPHFINNALQWLQIRLDKSKDIDAVNMVGKLSENISTVFRNSRNEKSHHTIQAELELVNNYLYIQKLRFGDKLQYDIQVEIPQQLMKEVEVPLMFIQIHAENGIEHGIRNNQNGAGFIQIKVYQESDAVIVELTDNGVGRVKAAEIGSKGTQSGTKILEELKGIFNEQNIHKLEQEYFDLVLTAEDGTKVGTTVKLTIPINFNYHI